MLHPSWLQDHGEYVEEGAEEATTTQLSAAARGSADTAASLAALARARAAVGNRAVSASANELRLRTWAALRENALIQRSVQAQAQVRGD